MNKLLRFDFDAFMLDKQALSVCLPILEEVEYRRNHPCYDYLPDDHEERPQLQFHQSLAPTRLLFGGKQSGKSRSAAQELKWILCGDHPYKETPKSPRVYVVSANYRTVQEGIWKHLKYLLPRWDITYTGQNIPGWQIPSFIQIRGGGQVDFISGDGREEARKKMQAAEIDVLAIDEEIDGETYKEGLYRLLKRNGILIVSATLDRSEPWCLALEDRADTGDAKVKVFRLSTYRAAKVGHLSEEKLAEIEIELSEEERLVKLLGHSRRHEGLVYGGFDANVHLIDNPYFVISPDVTRYCAIDPGQRSACGVLWIAVFPSSKYVIYRELYIHATKVLDVVLQILSCEGYEPLPGTNCWRVGPKTELIENRWMDPSGFAGTLTGEMGWGELLAKYSKELGLGTRMAVGPARNDVIPGIEACRRSLEADEDGLPRMRVLSTCKNFLREIRSYRWQRDDRHEKQNEAPDRPTKRNDHLLDPWRYLENMGLPYVPEHLRRVRRNDPTLPIDLDEGYTVTMQERLKRHWARSMEDAEEQKPQPAHVGGLGSEY